MGEALADTLAGTSLPILLLGSILSLALCASQSSATAAIPTTSGLLADMTRSGESSSIQVVLIALAIAIAFDSFGLSHVNDSGFWVVTRFLGLSISDGLRTWTVLTTVPGVAGFLIVSLLWFVLG